MGDVRAPRWDLWLPAAAVVLGLVLVLLAWTAAGALRDRHALVVDGRLVRLAHELEQVLREGGPGSAQQVLREALETEEGFLAGLAVLGPGGELEVQVGAVASSPPRRIDLFLGPAWHWGERGPAPGPPGPRGFGLGGGRRVLAVFLVPESLRPPPVARLLLPAAILAGLVLVALSLLGGWLLVRQREEERREGERRRLEAMARAGAGLAHQLRTPLATIKGSCQLLLEKELPAGAEKRLATILEQSDRMDRLLADLLDYARPPEPEVRPVALATVFGELEDFDPRVRVTAGEGLLVQSDAEHLRHVLGNLVTNALEVAPPGLPVELGARSRGGEVEIRVADRGPGPGEDPEHLFEPYVTSRAAGTGLGLPLARALAVANGGSVTLMPRPGGGTEAVVLLPGAEA